MVPGPDFPTGGFILGRQGIIDAYTRGRGQLKMRARAAIERMGKDREQIVVTEIPYQVNKSKLIEQARRGGQREDASKASATYATRATATACASSSS